MEPQHEKEHIILSFNNILGNDSLRLFKTTGI